MMRSGTCITLFAFVAHAHAERLPAKHIQNMEDSQNKFLSNLSDKLFNRACKACTLHHIDLENTTLEKGAVDIALSQAPVAILRSRNVPSLLLAPPKSTSTRVACIRSSMSEPVTKDSGSTLEYGGIAHQGVLVASTARAMNFYRDVLGMEDETHLRNAKLPFPGAFVRCGESQIHIMEAGNNGIPMNPDPTERGKRPAHGGRDRHIALTVRSLNPLKVVLDEAGVDYTMSKSGRAALFCRDPDGNAIEFMETPSISKNVEKSDGNLFDENRESFELFRKDGPKFPENIEESQKKA